MSKNSLQSLPATIGALRQLVVLNLMLNKIEALPPQIGELAKLERLKLSVNQVRRRARPLRRPGCKISRRVVVHLFCGSRAPLSSH